MYRLIFIFLYILSYGIEIDTSIEKHLAKNDIQNRLKLADYYIDKNVTKSKIFAIEVLKISPNNRLAKKILAKIKLKSQLDKIIKNQSIDKFYQKLYFDEKYEQIKKMRKYLVCIKSDYPKLITAKIYFWDGKYNITKNILPLPFTK